MIPINVKLKKFIPVTVEVMERLGKLTQTFPGEQGDLGLFFVLFVDDKGEEMAAKIGANENVEYAEVAPVRSLKA